MSKRISNETQRNLYQVIGILGILAELEPNEDITSLKKTIELAGEFCD